jgi:hypothetical protein
LLNRKSANDIEIEVGQYVIHSVGSPGGSYLVECAITRITYTGLPGTKFFRPYRIHLRQVSDNDGKAGRKLVAKSAVRLWVVYG